MPENDSFIGNMSGVRFVRYMAELAGLPPDVALERAHEASSMSDWARYGTEKWNSYSLGRNSSSSWPRRWRTVRSSLFSMSPPTVSIRWPHADDQLIKDIRKKAAFDSSFLLTCCETSMNMR